MSGTTLTITGRMKEGVNKVAFGLVAYSTTQFANIALHLEARFDEKVFARNSKINNAWGTEEKDGVLPFVLGEEYSLKIVCAKENFVIYVNEKQFATYKHRIDFKQVVSLNFWEGMELYNLVVEKPPRKEQIKPKLATEIPLKTSVVPGTSITVTGRIGSNADKITVNLLAYSTYKSQNIGLHFNIRFSESVVVRTSKIDNVWGTEERDGGCPFTKGKNFTLKIVCVEENYVIYVDDKQFTTYKHRTPIQTVAGLSFDGDVELHNVAAQGPPPKRQVGLAGKQILPELPLYGKILPGSAITVTGRVKETVDRVSFNLLSYSSVKFENIALRIEVRYDEKRVALCSKVKNTWGVEEYYEKLPFTQGSKYSLKIYSTEDSFVIYSDDVKFAEYKHRVPLQSVVGINFVDGMELYKLAVESPPPKQEIDLTGTTVLPELPVEGAISGSKYCQASSDGDDDDECSCS